MKKILLLTLTALVMLSCKVQHMATSERTVDSVNTKVIQHYRDTIVTTYLSKQQVMNVVLTSVNNGVVNSDTSILQIDHAISKAWVRDGKLFHILNTTNEKIDITLKNAIKETSKEVDRKRDHDKIVTVEVKTNILKWYQKLLMGMGILGLIYASFRFGKLVYFKK